MNNLKKEISIVDLDGTLIRSDMLCQIFWNAIRDDWKNIFVSMNALRQGKASLKSFLAKKSNVNIETLRYNHEAIKYVREKKSGAHVALVTATDHTIAEKIAHLRLKRFGILCSLGRELFINFILGVKDVES